MKLGIVGSSYSAGNHEITVKLQKKRHGLHSPRFEDVLKDCISDDNLEIYNFAIPGKGSEQFLSNITYLKKIYNIDFLLMQVVNDRELRQLRIPNKSYNDILQDYTNVNDFYNFLCAGKWLQYFSPESLRYIELEHAPEYMTKRELKRHCNTQYKYILDSEIFFTTKNILTALDLCLLLDIKVVLWDSNISIQHNVMFKNLIKNDNIYYIQMPNQRPSILYYREKYPKDAYVDSTHLSVECEKKLISEHIAPVLKKVMYGKE